MKMKSYKIAVRLIYFKAVTPSMDILALSEQQWREFFLASPIERRHLCCLWLDRLHLETSVREVAWIPLFDQRTLVEQP